MEKTCQLRMYREIHRDYVAARIELWPEGSRVPSKVDIFAFTDFLALLDFEQWIDATVYLLTGKDPTYSTRKAAR